MKISHIPAAVAMLTFASVCFGGEKSDWPEPLARALEALAETDDQYAYTRETRDELGHYIERFDPEKPRSEQWQLLSFNGGEPDKKHKERYAREYDGLFNRDHPTDVDLSSLFNRESLKVVETTPKFVIYEFQPLADEPEDEKIMSNLVGTLVVDVANNELNDISLNSKKKFSPAAMVSIKEFSITMSFDRIGENGPVVMTQSTSNIRGRFMGLKKIEQSQEVVFRDFDRVPDSIH